MPMFDFKCNLCSHIEQDVFQHVYVKFPCRQRIPFEYETDAHPSTGSHPCGGTMEKTLIPGNATNVIGDECDVLVKHGICHSDGSPRRFRSKSEMKRAAAARGLVNYVEHKPLPGTDKSPHTTRWT